MTSQLSGVPYGPLPTAARYASALAQPPRLIVIHDTSNTATAKAEASYAASRPADGATSAHFYVDATGPLGSCPLDIQAWAAYSYANSHGWHVEMCGYNAGQAGAVPASTIALTAKLVHQLCQLGGIPMVKLSPADVAAGKRGICGHADITTGLGVGDHDDPGPRFDWAAFIAAVTHGDDMLTTDERKILDEIASRVRYIDGRVEALEQGRDVVADQFPSKGTTMWAVGALKAAGAPATATVDPAVLQAAVDAAVAKAIPQIVQAMGDSLAQRLAQ